MIYSIMMINFFFTFLKRGRVLSPSRRGWTLTRGRRISSALFNHSKRLFGKGLSLIQGRFFDLTGTIGKSDLFPIDPNFFIFLKIGCILVFYFNFVVVYETMFPEKAPHILPNPLQVIAQLSCFFFFYFYKKREVLQKHICLLHLFCSMSMCLYLQGLPISFLFFFLYLGYSL